MKGKFSEMVGGEIPVLVDFYADWCGPCKMVTPILRDLKSKLGDQVKIMKIDVDKNSSISQKFGIQSIPTLILFRNGEVKWRQSGVVPLKQLEQAVKANSQ
jgi:thioredoxin 1